MQKEITTAEKMRALPWGVVYSAANSAYCQLTMFGSVFVLFLSELGMTKTQIGMVLSLFPFASVLSVFIAPYVAGFGYKRTFLTFWGGRKLITALLFLTPWILSTYGTQGTLTFVIVVVALFTIFRAIAMTALQPWQMESIPNSVRGKYSATKMFFARIASFLAVTLAGYVLGEAPDLDSFMILFGIGVPIGLLGVWLASFIPGGAPERQKGRRPSHGHMLAALKDRRFVLFVLGSSLITLALGPLSSFLPLFMQEQVGLSSGNTVMLQTGAMVGSLLSSYLWGWAADRYGSSPVMLSGVYLLMLLPIVWLLMPRQSVWSLYIALAVSFLDGVARMGWMIGSGRLLFVNIVPSGKRAGYTSLRFTWLGIIGGLGNFISGRVLDFTANMSGQFLLVTIDPYTILFLVSLVLPLLSSFVLRSVRSDSRVTTGEFAGMFVRGNPLQALMSLVKFHRAKDERAAVSTTEDLGQARSPLTVDELLEALEDPRFYVRFEAIVSIARTNPSEQLIQALIKVLDGDSPALSVIAAWALGRMDERDAIPALRQGLDARYRSIQAHCARSLGSIGDETIAPLLLKRLKDEQDHGLRLAYASALGKLGSDEAVDELLRMLRTSRDRGPRMELALALARLLGDERWFIQLLRETYTEPGTAISQAVASLRKPLRKYCGEEDGLSPLIDSCGNAFAREDLARGVILLARIIHALPLDQARQTAASILQECVSQMKELGADRVEYILLAIQAIEAGFSRERDGVLARVLPTEDLDLI